MDTRSACGRPSAPRPAAHGCKGTAEAELNTGGGLISFECAVVPQVGREVGGGEDCARACLRSSGSWPVASRPVLLKRSHAPAEQRQTVRNSSERSRNTTAHAARCLAVPHLTRRVDDHEGELINLLAERAVSDSYVKRLPRTESDVFGLGQIGVDGCDGGNSTDWESRDLT